MDEHVEKEARSRSRPKLGLRASVTEIASQREINEIASQHLASPRQIECPVAQMVKKGLSVVSHLFLEPGSDIMPTFH